MGTRVRPARAILLYFLNQELFCACDLSNTDIAGKREGGIEANFAKIYRIIAQIHPWCISDFLISLQVPQWNLSQLSYSSKFLG